MLSRTDLVRGYFEAYQARDRGYVEAGMTEDFTFTSPYDSAIPKSVYFERCWPNEGISAILIERIVEQGDEAFVTYLCVTNDGRQFRNTEFFLFRGQRLAQIHVYFGASYRDGVFIPSNPG